MHEISKLSSGIQLIIIVVVLIVSVMCFTRNYYKPIYEKTDAVTYEEANTNLVGYPAGDDIPAARSVEDIKKYKYFTIEISQENIVSTRFFVIKEENKAGIKTSRTTSGRHRSSSTITIYEAFCYGQDLRGDISYKMRQLDFNMKEVSYGEYFIVTLESGEKVKVWMDPLLLDIKKKEYTRLPVCTYFEGMSSDVLDEFGEQQGVTEENKSLYVDAIGKWEQRETETVDPFEYFMLTLIVGAVVLAVVIFVSSKVKKFHTV